LNNLDLDDVSSVAITDFTLVTSNEIVQQVDTCNCCEIPPFMGMYDTTSTILDDQCVILPITDFLPREIDPTTVTSIPNCLEVNQCQSGLSLYVQVNFLYDS
jgi:hypothetical protein